MKKFLQKKPMLLLCALLLFSLGCMGVLAVAEPKSTGSTAETEVMTEGAVPLADGVEDDGIELVSLATPMNSTRTVTLEPGEGTLAEDDVILVDEETGEILTDLPDPNSSRTGWEFTGWYTKPITKEVYLDGGDITGDGAPYSGDDYSNTKDIAEKLKEQMEGTHLLEQLEANSKEDLDTKIIQYHHSWLIDTFGDKVEKGDTIKSDVTELYAMYVPKTVSINWNYNGWNGRNGTLKSGRSYDGYAYTGDWGNVTWGDRTLKGWSFSLRGGTVDLEPGCVYKIGGKYLTPDRVKNGSVTLYAVWSGNEVTQVKIDIFSDGAHFKGHDSTGWFYYVEYTQLPVGATREEVTWSIEPEGVGTVTKQGGTYNQAIVDIDAHAVEARNLEAVTVKATTANGVVGTKTIQLEEHKWEKAYTYEANCQHDGYVDYECKICHIRRRYDLPQKDHNFITKHTPATCTEPGYTDMVCTVCGTEEVTQEKAALGHNWGEEKTVEICGGVAHIHTCLTCGVTESDVDVNNADHQWSTEFVIDQEPTCGRAGSRSYHCLKCDLTKDSEIIPPDPSLHNWSKWSVIKQPQVGVTGTKRRTCGNCRTEETEDIPALLPTPESAAQKDTNDEVQEPAEEEIPEVVTPPQTPEAKPAPEEETKQDTAEVPADKSSSDSGSSSTSSAPGNNANSTTNGSSSSSGGSSSGGSSGGGGFSGGSGGGGGFSGGSGGGGGAVKAGAGPSAGAAATPLPLVPTAEIRAALPTYVEVGTWDKAADGSWTCKDENGQPYTNEWAAVYNPYANTAAADAFDWFRFDATGHMIKGWYVDPVDGNTYYMNEASDGTQGKMMTGWVTIGGKEYYFNPNSDGQRGRMYKNEMTPDGHYVGPDGAKVW